MGVLIESWEGLSNTQLAQLREIDEQLTERGDGIDNRVLADSASIVVNKVGDNWAITLLGRIEGTAFGITITDHSWQWAIESVTKVLCQIFKVPAD